MIRPDESIDDLMYRALYRSAILVVWELKSPPGRFDPPHAREDRMPAVWILELDEHDQAADRPDIDQSGAKLDFPIPRRARALTLTAIGPGPYHQFASTSRQHVCACDL